MRIKAVFLIIAMLLIYSAAAEDDYIRRTWNEDAGVYIYSDDSGESGLMDKDGGIIFEASLFGIYGYSEGMFLAADIIDGNHCYGYIDSAGRTVIPFIYKFAMPFSDGYAPVKVSDKMGYITPDGAWAWDKKPAYSDAKTFSEGYAPVSEGDKYYFIDESGEKAFDGAEFKQANSFSCGLALVKTDGKYRYIGTDGEFAFDARFKEAHDFDCGIAYTYRNKKGAQFIDTQGNVLLTFDENIYEFDIHDENTIIVSGTFYTRTENGFTEVPSVTSDFDHTLFYPNHGKSVAVLDEEATLSSIPDKSRPLPRVDGATALLPMYSAFVQAVYPDSVRYEEVWKNPDALITCTRTAEAYRRLTDEECDIIFCAGPSEAQLSYAESCGVEFLLTPIGKEAFVFIVNNENPIDNISVQNIKDIYSGNITSWDELGISGLGEIIPYQRPENSGSQTALEEMMGDIPLMDAPEAIVAWDMGSILDRVEYRNYPNAIGYSFRFYVTGLTQANVKLLSLDGIAPTVENIASGAYPQTSTLYAVTRKGDDNPNLAAFLEWVQSDQAAELIEKSGYVPWCD